MGGQPKSFLLDEGLFDYIVGHGTPLTDVQRDLIEVTAALGDVAGMQIAPEQGQFMTLLARLIGAESAIEVGTFTGYSALAIAMGLREGGRLLCCEVDEAWIAIAREHWDRAGVGGRIDVVIGPALETLGALPATARFDLAFIDAHKPEYVAYFEELVPRLRPGGVVLADNVLWDGTVIDPAAGGADVEGIRAFNDHVVRDDRVDAVMLPIGDGLTLAVKR